MVGSDDGWCWLAGTVTMIGVEGQCCLTVMPVW